jgi:sugar lactone lactonase YvrE
MKRIEFPAGARPRAGRIGAHLGRASACGLTLAALVLAAPRALAQPVLYVSDFTTNTVSTIPAGGGSATGVSFSSPPGPALSGLTGLAFDSARNLYVSDASNDRVLKITPGGASSVYASGMSGCQGLAIDGADNLYVAGINQDEVFKVAPTTPAPTTTVFASGLNGPVGLAYDRASNSLYVSNHGHSNDGTTVSRFNGSGGLVNTFTGFNVPQGLALDDSGDLYVSNGVGGQVNKVNLSNGSILATYSGFGNPIGLAFDNASGNLFVGDFTNASVSEVSPTGTVTPNYGTGIPHPDFVTLAPVPEPSSLLLGGFGAAFLGLATRRHRRNTRPRVQG